CCVLSHRFMELRNTSAPDNAGELSIFNYQFSNSENGFTLIEIMIAVGILAIIATLGLFVSFDFYKGYAFRSEKSIVVSTLQKARDESLSNINQTRHGVHFGASPLQYIIFECPS